MNSRGLQGILRPLTVSPGAVSLGLSSGLIQSEPKQAKLDTKLILAMQEASASVSPEKPVVIPGPASFAMREAALAVGGMGLSVAIYATETPTHRIYVIEAEDRVYVIALEKREASVEREERVVNVEPELRISAVENERREVMA